MQEPSYCWKDRFVPLQLHAVAPTREYDEPPQGRQADCAVRALYDPAGHEMQSVIAPFPVDGWYVLAGHSNSTDDPAGQYFPMPQIRPFSVVGSVGYWTVVLPKHKYPAGQVKHSDRSGAAPYVPGPHAAQFDTDVLLLVAFPKNVPAGQRVGRYAKGGQ